MNGDEAEHLSELLKIHKKRLSILEEQSAKYGLNCPPEILMEIEELREKADHFERQVRGNIIETFIQGKNVLGRFNLDLDTIEHGLSNVVIKEERVFRFLGIPLWSSVAIRTITTLVTVATIASVIYTIVGKDRFGQVFPGLFPTRTPASLPTSASIPTPTTLLIPTPTSAPMPTPTTLSTPTPTTLPIPPPTALSIPAPTTLPVRVVQGVLSKYTYTGRVATDATGTFTRMRETPDVTSQRIGILRNGDGVAILRDDVPRWYQARIIQTSDPAQIGVEGWIERWLVDDIDVPALPTSSPRGPTPRPSTEVPTTIPAAQVISTETPAALIETPVLPPVPTLPALIGTPVLPPVPTLPALIETPVLPLIEGGQRIIYLP